MHQFKLADNDNGNKDGDWGESVSDEQTDANLKNEAAIKIQSCYRGYSVRNEYSKNPSKNAVVEHGMKYNY